MRTFSKFLVAGAGVAMVAGAGIAAGRNAHVLNVVLPDGSVEQVRYVGNVAPRIVSIPAGAAASPFDGLDPFAAFDAVAAHMDAQADAMLRQVAALQAAALPAAPMPSARMPAGSVSYSVTAFSSGDGGATCRQSMQVTSYGTGRQPTVVRHSDGDCTAMNRAAPTPAVRTAPPAAVAPPALTAARYEAPAAPAKPRPTI